MEKLEKPLWRILINVGLAIVMLVACVIVAMMDVFANYQASVIGLALVAILSIATNILYDKAKTKTGGKIMNVAFLVVFALCAIVAFCLCMTDGQALEAEGEVNLAVLAMPFALALSVVVIPVVYIILFHKMKKAVYFPFVPVGGILASYLLGLGFAAIGYAASFFFYYGALIVFGAGVVGFIVYLVKKGNPLSEKKSSSYTPTNTSRPSSGTSAYDRQRNAFMYDLDAFLNTLKENGISDTVSSTVTVKRNIYASRSGTKINMDMKLNFFLKNSRFSSEAEKEAYVKSAKSAGDRYVDKMSTFMKGVSDRIEKQLQVLYQRYPLYEESFQFHFPGIETEWKLEE